MLIDEKYLSHVTARKEPRPEAVERHRARAAELFSGAYGLDTSDTGGWENVEQFVGEYVATDCGNRRLAREGSMEPPYSPPAHGLILIGPTGTGKTTAARAIAKMLQLEYYTAKEIDKAYSREENGGIEGIEREFPALYRDHCIIDDIGAEEGKNHFKNGPIIPDILSDRWDEWRYRGRLTILTTNLRLKNVKADKSTIGGRYNERVYSRVFQMCKQVYLRGFDRREFEHD